MIFDKIFKKSKDSTSSPTETIDYYSEGVSHFNAGQYTRAMEYFQAAIDYQPARESAYMELAETYIKMGKEDLAKKTLFALLAINPNNKKALAEIQSFLTPKPEQKKDSSKTVQKEASNSYTSVKLQTAQHVNEKVAIPQPTVSHPSAPNDPVVNVIPPSQNDTPYWMVEQQSGNRFYVRTIGQECELVPPNMKKDYCGHISTNWDGFKGPSGRLVIPSSIRIGGEDYLVTSVGKKAFCLSGDFTKVELPQTIKKIGEGAFCGTNIEVVILPDSVIEIAPLAFHMCSKLHSIQLPTKITLLRHHLLTDTKINELIIPDSVAVIENEFFCGREQYGKLTLTMMGKPPQIEECPFILGGFVQKDVFVPQVFWNHYNNARFWQTMNLIPY